LLIIIHVLIDDAANSIILATPFIYISIYIHLFL